MGMLSKVLRIQVPSSPGSVGYTGAGFQPKAAIVVATQATVIGSNADAGISIGFCTASNQQYSLGMWELDNSASVSSRRTGSTTRAIFARGSAGTVLFEGQITAFNADGLTINWVEVTGGAEIVILLLWWSDAATAKAGQIAASTSTGNVAYTDPALTPKVVFFLTSSSTTAAVNATSASMSFGVACATGQWVAGISSVNGQGTMVEWKHFRDDACVMQMDIATGGTVPGYGGLQSLDATGFTINYADAFPGANIIFYLAIPYIDAFVDDIAIPTSTGDSAIGTTAFTPAAFLSAVSRAPVNLTTTHTDGLHLGVGMASSATARGAITVTSLDAAADSAADTVVDDSNVVRGLTPSAGGPTTDYLADFVSFSATGATLNWSNAETTSDRIGVVLLGPVESPSVSVASPGAPVWFG